MWTELIGVVASVIVAMSFISRKQKIIRIINIIGSILFIIYGALINSPSVFLLNSLAIIINVTRIIQHIKQKNSTQIHS